MQTRLPIILSLLPCGAVVAVSSVLVVPGVVDLVGHQGLQDKVRVNIFRTVASTSDGGLRHDLELLLELLLALQFKLEVVLLVVVVILVREVAGVGKHVLVLIVELVLKLVRRVHIVEGKALG